MASLRGKIFYSTLTSELWVLSSSEVRASDPEHGGSWVRIPSGAQIFSVSSYGWFFTSPFISSIIKVFYREQWSNTDQSHRRNESENQDKRTFLSFARFLRQRISRKVRSQLPATYLGWLDLNRLLVAFFGFQGRCIRFPSANCRFLQRDIQSALDCHVTYIEQNKTSLLEIDILEVKIENNGLKNKRQKQDQLQVLCSYYLTTSLFSRVLALLSRCNSSKRRWDRLLKLRISSESLAKKHITANQFFRRY